MYSYGVCDVSNNESHVMPFTFCDNVSELKPLPMSLNKPQIKEVATYVSTGLCSHTQGLCKPGVASQECPQVTLNIWFPSSPDLNSLEFYVWSIVKQANNQWHHNTKNSLKAAILNVIASMNKKILIQICSHFRGHTDAILKAEDRFIELHVIFFLLNIFIFIYNLCSVTWQYFILS